jgi:hypothetical protein
MKSGIMTESERLLFEKIDEAFADALNVKTKKAEAKK